MPLFDRVANIKVETPNGLVQVENLRISFAIKKTMAWGTNSCAVSIWNMNPSKRSALRELGDRLTLSAGYDYQSGTGVLFVGNTTQTNHKFLQPEIISTIECNDGERNFNEIFVSISFNQRVAALTVLRDIASKMQLEIAQLVIPQDLEYPNGYSNTGRVSQVLQDVCDYLKVQWSIQNETLIILPVNAVSNKPIAEININTGMIGVPTQFTYRAKYLPGAARLIGWRVQTLLRPEILPGDQVRIISNKVNFNLDGNFKVVQIVHNGDTHGNPWDSTLEVIPVVTQ